MQRNEWIFVTIIVLAVIGVWVHDKQEDRKRAEASQQAEQKAAAAKEAEKAGAK